MQCYSFQSVYYFISFAFPYKLQNQLVKIDLLKLERIDILMLQSITIWYLFIFFRTLISLSNTIRISVYNTVLALFLSNLTKGFIVLMLLSWYSFHVCCKYNRNTDDFCILAVYSTKLQNSFITFFFF